MRRLPRFLLPFAVNAVPAVGLFAEGWSAGTVLALYWFENLLGSVLVGLRIALHRRLTGKRGHFRPQLGVQVTSGSGSRAKEHRFRSFLSEFLTGALAFNLAHGVFLAILLGAVLPDVGGPGAGVECASLGQGAAALAALLALGFGIDLVGLRDRPFVWVRERARYALSRAVVIHMAIILGMFGTMVLAKPMAVFSVFIALKTLLDLSSSLPQWNPEQPPGWLARAMDRLKKPGKEEDFATYWQRTREEERRTAEDDEQVGPPAPAAEPRKGKAKRRSA